MIEYSKQPASSILLCLRVVCYRMGNKHTIFESFSAEPNRKENIDLIIIGQLPNSSLSFQTPYWIPSFRW